MRLTLKALAACAAIALLLELGTHALVATGQLAMAPPLRSTPLYWRGDHPQFGVWHEPNSTFAHQSPCFRVQYSANSAGARDVERSERSDQPRVLVLGDSFFEGWGVPLPQRLSNLLERRTGTPHLNFAMAHFGPYQSLLAYRSLASRYDHDKVIVSVVPANDFIDLDFDEATTRWNYEYLYRPYLRGPVSDLQHEDYRESGLRRFLRRWSYAFNAALHARRVFEYRAARDAQPAEPAPPWSGFYDFNERQWLLLEATLERLSAEVGPRKLAVVLVPVYKDLQRRGLEGADPLSERMVGLAGRLNFELVNLLPAMSSVTDEWGRYFFRCDYHWNPVGNGVGARSVLEALGPEFYGEAARPAKNESAGK